MPGSKTCIPPDDPPFASFELTRPEVIAHRGFALRHPENTVDAFRAAVDLGVAGIELDVHATADGVLVVHHDAHLTPNLGEEPEAIAAITWTEVRRRSALVPSLPEVLEAIPEDVTLYVEIKASGIERPVCNAIGRRPHCAVHSFDHRSIGRCRELAPALPRGVLMTSYLLDPAVPLRDTGSRDLWQHWELIDEALVERIHSAGGRVIAWTVNSVDVARRLARIGVAGICTDSSDTMLDAFS